VVVQASNTSAVLERSLAPQLLQMICNCNTVH